MKKSLLVTLTVFLLIGFNGESSIKADNNAEIIAKGYINGAYASDTTIFYNLKDNITKLYSLYAFDIATKETSLLVKDHKSLYLLSGQYSTYADGKSCVWMEDDGLWVWLPDLGQAKKVSTISFNNGIGLWNGYVAFSDNWSTNAPGIYLFDTNNPKGTKRIFNYKYKHQLSSLKVANGYVAWIDKTKYVSEDPKASARIIGGDISLYDIKNDKVIEVDKSDKMKCFPVIQNNMVVYIEYNSDKYRLEGGKIIAYNIGTQTKTELYEAKSGTMCSLIENPNANYALLCLSKDSQQSLICLFLPQNGQATSEAIDLGFCSQINTQMIHGNKVVWINNKTSLFYKDNLSKTDIPASLLSENGKIFTAKATSDYLLWTEQITNNEYGLKIVYTK